MSNLKKFKRDLSWSKDYGKMIKMISDESYIRWIEDFTNTHSEFSSDDWDYKPDEISPEDYANVVDLDLFFRAISNYVEDYYLVSRVTPQGFYDNYFVLKFNNVAYLIGLCVGQGAFTYCHRLNSIPENCIDFKCIAK